MYSDSELYNSVEKFEISSPIFVDCNAEKGKYLNSEFKVLYVGQETNYWFNEKEREQAGLLSSINDKDKYLKALVSLYSTFNIGEKYRSSIFTFLDLVISELETYKKSVGVLWTNVLRHDYYGYKRVPYNVESKITYENNYILRKEIEILKPNAIVFVTGPSYDLALKNTYRDLKFIEIESWSLNECAILESDVFKCKAIRVYHPNAHNRRGADYKHELSKLISRILN